MLDQTEMDQLIALLKKLVKNVTDNTIIRHAKGLLIKLLDL